MELLDADGLGAESGRARSPMRPVLSSVQHLVLWCEAQSDQQMENKPGLVHQKIMTHCQSFQSSLYLQQN